MRFPPPPGVGRPPTDYGVDRPEVEAPRGALELTGTNWPTLNNTNQHRTPGAHNHCTGSRPTHTPTNTHQRGGKVNKLAVVMAWGKRPAPFRTRKLSPTAPMVLPPTGGGRVGHHRNHTKQVRPRPAPLDGAEPHPPNTPHNTPTQHTHPTHPPNTPHKTSTPAHRRTQTDNPRAKTRTHPQHTPTTHTNHDPASKAHTRSTGTDPTREHRPRTLSWLS